jgi:Acetyltransferase (GNAT) domain
MAFTQKSIPAHLHAIDPLQDARWGAFVEGHPRASVFHTVPWLDALHRTYGYKPIVYTTSPPGADLQNGLVFCCVESGITGRRLVSLPFSDHCEPLIDSAEELESILSCLQAHRRSSDWRYIEIRPLTSSLRRSSAPEGFQPSKQYCFHTIDLRPQENELFHGFHESSVQRRIRRAERAGLVCESGRSRPLLKKFHQLMLLTRRRHKLLPQPEEWFRNLVECMGDALKIWVVSRENIPVASILTLRFKNTLVFKYGCSDSAYRRLGSTPLVFWKAIQQAKSDGVQEFDLGRSDCDNRGLIAFKDHWASMRSLLTYWRFTASAKDQLMRESRKLKLANHFLGLLPKFLPKSMHEAAGGIFYRHFG